MQYSNYLKPIFSFLIVNILFIDALISKAELKAGNPEPSFSKVKIIGIFSLKI